MNTPIKEVHKTYPFVFVCNSAAFYFEKNPGATQADFDAFHGALFNGSDWFILVGDEFYFVTYSSKEEALEQVDDALFSSYKDFKVAREQLRNAVEGNNIELALLLSERIGYHCGERDARLQFKKGIKEAMGQLSRYA